MPRLDTHRPPGRPATRELGVLQLPGQRPHPQNGEDSPYDLRPARRLDEPGLLSIELTDDEHSELRRLQVLDLDSERVVWSAYRAAGRLLLVGTEDDLDNLVGFIAFEANHAEDRRRQRRLDQVIGKLEGALRTFV